MTIQMKSLRERAHEFGNLLPFMEGREKADFDRLLGTPITIRNFGMMVDENKKEYVAFTVDEDPDNFYFGGKVLTENMQALESEGYREAIETEGLPVLFGKKKSKNKGENGVALNYTTVEFYPTPLAEASPTETKKSK